MGGDHGHGRPLSQETVAGWLGITQAQLSRIENGPAVQDLGKLVFWAEMLGIPAELLWFRLPGRPEGAGWRSPAKDPVRIPITDTDDMNRRELLRLLTLVGPSTASGVGSEFDRDRVVDNSGGTRALDAPTVDQYAVLNDQLWRAFADTDSKSAVFPLARAQLDLLAAGLRRTTGLPLQKRMCGLIADVLQLVGEIFFDSNRFTEAAHSYTMAATAAREADAFDLWACAMIRHAFLLLQERQFDGAVPVLREAARLARRGDSSLSTRYWAEAVHAQALAGLAQGDACRRSLDLAGQVHALPGPCHNGGWLRFDGSRLPEESGACYVNLNRPDLAEGLLSGIVARDISPRRRGAVLADLAVVAAQKHDGEQLLLYATAALDTARRTGSGFVGTRLLGLRRHLAGFGDDRRVCDIDRQIATLAAAG